MYICRWSTVPSSWSQRRDSKGFEESICREDNAHKDPKYRSHEERGSKLQGREIYLHNLRNSDECDSTIMVWGWIELIDLKVMQATWLGTDCNMTWSEDLNGGVHSPLIKKKRAILPLEMKVF